jgi:hypothetical protein
MNWWLALHLLFMWKCNGMRYLAQSSIKRVDDELASNSPWNNLF